MILSLLLVVSACSNDKEAQNNPDTRLVAKAAIETTKTGMDCCPPSVVERVVKQVEGVGKTAIKVSGGTGKVTVFFDDEKTDIQAILDFALGVE